MRSISETAGMVILIVYWMITISTWWAISGWLKQNVIRLRTSFNCLYFVYSLCLSILFITFYFIHPEQSGTHYYSFYCTFNALFAADLVCKIPFAIAALAFIFLPGHQTRMILLRMGFILSTGMGLVFLFGFLQGTKSYVTHEVTLTFPNLPPAFNGFRIVQLSDTHLGSSNMKKLLKNLSAVSVGFKPDLVVFTGDLVNNYAREAIDYPAAFLHFKSSYGNYAIPGNHDYGDYTQWPDSLKKVRNLSGIKRAFRESGFHLLCNESEKIIKGGDSIYMVGVENPGHPPFPQYADLVMAAKGLPDNAFCILLCHDPDFWDSTFKRDYRFPITLAGHTHGLQWGIHLAGIQFSMIKPIQKRWGGLYEHDKRYLYVNRGIGLIGMHFRIDMPAEITLLTLQRGEINR